MSDLQKEQISALVDGQLPEQEQELLLARLLKDDELAGCWHRYHLISDALNQHLPEQVTRLSDRVRDALSDDAPLAGSAPKPSSAWARRFAGLAVAASVAAVAVLGVRTMQVETPATAVVASAGTTPPAGSLSLPRAGTPNDIMRANGIQWNVDKPRVANRLNSYLLIHSEYAASAGVPGIGPHARIVGYDTGR